MVLILGTNAGFVTTAPTADPGGSIGGFEGTAAAIKDVAPEGAIKITEIGIWIDNASQAADMQVGLYDHDSPNNEPADLLSASGDFAKGTTAGWKVKTGLNISITSGTTYWIAAQLDSDASSTFLNYKTTGGLATAWKNAESLPADWGSSDSRSVNWLYGLYALVEVAVGTNMSINIADTFKDVDSLQINIGDVWKDVVEVQQNIGDVWKTVF